MFEEIQQLYEEGKSHKATAPEPADGSVYVDPNTVLSWLPGKDAVSHNVYLGTNFDDVNDANAFSAEYMGNFDVSNFDPCGLDLETSYFWRVDEVTASSTYKGDIWSFTTFDPNDPNLMAGWWKFDEGSGTDANDSAGSNDGTLYGDPCWVTGKIGDYALDFDGVDDYVRIPDDDSISVGNQDYTISTWINPRSLTGPDGGATIVSKVKDDSDKEYRLWIRDGDLWHEVEKNASNQAAYTTTAPVQTDSWQHIAVTFNSSTTTPTLYYNGAVQTSINYIDTLPDQLNNDLYIGMTGGTYQTNEFNGLIDDVRIYDRALTSGEIQQLYQQGL